MKKIMFNDKYGLTQAVLEGRKTMTRRIIPKKYGNILKFYEKGVLLVPLSCIPKGVSIEDFAKQWTETSGKIRFVPIDGKKEPQVATNCIDSMLEAAKFDSRYKVGKIVAVAQSYKEAGFPPSYIIDEFHPNIEHEAGWTNKMFVSAQLMPHRIEITDLHVERLQSISEEDCLKEGIYEVPFCEFAWEDNGKTFKTAREAFAALIDKISGKGTWDKNPYVFAYSFTLVK